MKKMRFRIKMTSMIIERFNHLNKIESFFTFIFSFLFLQMTPAECDLIFDKIEALKKSTAKYIQDIANLAIKVNTGFVSAAAVAAQDEDQHAPQDEEDQPAPQDEDQPAPQQEEVVIDDLELYEFLRETFFSLN